MKFDFLFRNFIISLTKLTINQLKLNLLRLVYHKKIIDVILFANAQMKFRYDNKHKLLMFIIDDIIYLRLYKKYFLFSKLSKKVFNQYVELFFVKRRINRLIYELNLFFILWVYFIISIIQLKSIDVFFDSYQRFKFNYFEFINIDQQNKNENSCYEVKKNRRSTITYSR